MIAIASWTQPTDCATCGAPVEHRQRVDYRRGTASWSPVRHTAPCGAACAGGPLRRETAPTLPGVSGLAHAHRADACGAPGCGCGRGAT